MITVLGSVEDESTFSTLNYMKLKIRNNLQEHLDLMVCMYGQSFYDLKSFPMHDATKWKEVRVCYGTLA